MYNNFELYEFKNSEKKDDKIVYKPYKEEIEKEKNFYLEFIKIFLNAI